MAEKDSVFCKKFLEYLDSICMQKFRGRQASMAEALGLHAATLGRYLLRQRGPSFGDLGKMIDSLGLRVLWDSDSSGDVEAVQIPIVSAVVGAGESWETGKQIVGFWAVPQDVVRDLHVRTADAVIMRVRGDSMEPQICDGDMVLIDQSDTSCVDGSLIVCAFGEVLTCKRVQRLLDGVRLCPDNPRYQPLDIRGDELSKLAVVGRVRWFCRSL